MKQADNVYNAQGAPTGQHMTARLRHAEHAGGYFLPAGTIGEIVSRHRLHARVAIAIDGQRRILRLPLVSLEIGRS